jgi:hypothetical protein
MTTAHRLDEDRAARAGAALFPKGATIMEQTETAPVVFWACECEHARHFHGGAHEYLDRFDRDLVQATATAYGSFRLCRACREGCHGA